MDGGAWWAAVHGVARSQTWLNDFTFTFRFHALKKEMATHSSVLAWRIPGMGEPGGLPSMGSLGVSHDWSNLAAAAAEHLKPFALQHDPLCWNRWSLNQLHQDAVSHTCWAFLFHGSSVCMHVCSRSCPTLFSPVDCSLPNSSVYGIFQARILEGVAISYPRGSSWPREWTHISWVSCIDRWILLPLGHLGSPQNDKSWRLWIPWKY